MVGGQAAGKQSGLRPAMVAPVMASYPVLVVSGFVLKDDRVLLVRRGKPPSQGQWAFPGGRVEPGERLEQAVIREIAEEAAIVATEPRRIGLLEIIHRDDAGTLESHFVLIVFACRHQSGVLKAGDDAADAGWFAREEATALPLTDGTRQMLREHWITE
jgi:ADP-ribose pyrophosphatase YjhB (NUDIX family)